MAGPVSNTRFWLTAAGVAALVGGLLWLAREDGRREYEAERPERATLSAVGAIPTGWQARVLEDPMTGEQGRVACTASDNSVDLGWPYGLVRANLCIRRTAREGLDGYVRIMPDGIIVCHTNDCGLTLRVDDGPLQTFSAVDAADGSSDIVFVENPRRLQRALTGSTTARVEVELHDFGRAVFRFQTRETPAI